MKKAVSFLVFAFGFVGLVSVVSCGNSTTSTTPAEKIDKGYTSDKDYSPTLDSRGEYHNNGTGDRQIQYQGSREQQQDLDAIDEYARTHPDF